VRECWSHRGFADARAVPLLPRRPPRSRLWPAGGTAVGLRALTLWCMLCCRTQTLAGGTGCPAASARANVSFGPWSLTVAPYADLPEATSGSVPCRAAHSGYEGDIGLACAGGILVGDSSACRRARCLAPGLFVRRFSNLALTEKRVEGLPSDTGSMLWSNLAITDDGRMLAAPVFTQSALEIDATGRVRTFGDLNVAMPLLYYTCIAIPGRAAAYGLPFFGDQVVLIDAGASTMSLVGANFGFGGSKWYGGAYAEGSVWGIPFDHSRVLRIDVATGTVSFAGLDLSAFGKSKWWEAVAVGRKVLGIPSDATELLLIDAASGSVSTFGSGLLGAVAGKWRGAVAIPGISVVYAVPHGHGRVLKVDVLSATAQLIGPDFGLATGKWSGAVLAGDGTVFGIPHGAMEVLRIDPATDGVRTFGSLPSGAKKWTQGVLAPDGRVLGLPGGRSDILRIDPVEEVIVLESTGLQSWESTASKWSGAVLGRDGAVYAPPGEAKTVLRVGETACLKPPGSIDEKCTFGDSCRLTIRGPFVRASTNKLRVLEEGQCAHSSAVEADFKGWVHLAAADDAGPAMVNFTLGIATSGIPLLVGKYRLCWGDDPLSPDDFDQDVGFLVVQGPLPANVSCMLGHPCTIELVGRELFATDQVAVTPHFTGGAVPVPAPMSGLVNPSSGMSATIFKLGTPLQGQPGGYDLRWSRAGVTSWQTVLGVFTLQGPSALGNRTCSLGEPCTLSVQGVDLLASDSLTLVPWPDLDCGSAHNESLRRRVSGWCDEATGICSFGAVGAAGGQGSFALGVASALPAVFISAAAAASASSNGVGTKLAPTVTLCWQSSAASAIRAAAFPVALGRLTLLGPLRPQEQGQDAVVATCLLGKACSVLVRGFDLANTDTLAVVAGGPCRPAGASYGDAGVGALADMGVAANPVTALEVTPASPASSAVLVAVTFAFGAARRGAGLLRLCWERAQAAGHSAVEVGKLDLRENGCAAPPTDGAESPTCQEGAVVPHLGACTPHCKVGWDPSSSSPLQCDTGVLTPTNFQCHERCASPPFVPNSGVQNQCSNMATGSVCSPACPADHIQSGDFLCTGGIWTHRPNPALTQELLYAVPRCYRPCDPSVFPAVADATRTGCASFGGAVPHGGRCTTTCNAGFTAFDTQVTQKLPSLQCRDGSLEPSTFVCIPSCNAPPIPYAVNLDLCANTPHGGTCELQCVPGYRKSGDLYCDQGTFSAATCKRPCDLQAIWPQGVPNTEDFMCMGLGSSQVLHQDQVCTPACLPGFSNTNKAEYSRCLDGAMVPPTLRCYADCPVAPKLGLIPGAADFSETCGYLRHGRRCPLICQEGYVSYGDVVCNTGKFEFGTCRRDCGTLPIAVGVGKVDHCYGTHHGDTCQVQCQEVFVWRANPTCQDGSWDSLDLCFSPCHTADVPGPESHGPASLCYQGEVITHGSTCTYQCAEGYGTAAVAQCANGSLQPATYSCAPLPSYTCGPASGVPGISAKDGAACSGTGHGEFCMVFCIENYRRVEDLRCWNGTWNSPCLDLRVRCGVPPLVPNGNTFDTCQDVVGSRCAIGCGDGFGPSNISGFECGADGEWVLGAKCIDLRCGSPPRPAHGRLVCNGGRSAADRCEALCDEGFGPAGTLECVDNLNGVMSWAPTTPVANGGQLCDALPCREPPTVPGVLVHSCYIIPHGGSCSAFSCQEGLKKTGAYACKNGRSSALPSCLADAEQGLVSVPAAVFNIAVELSATWGNLMSSSDWGGRASPLLSFALEQALFTSGEPAEVVLLGWGAVQAAPQQGAGADVGGSGGGALRRLGIGVSVDFLAAVALKAVASNSSAIAVNGAEIIEGLAERVAELKPGALTGLVKNSSAAPSLIDLSGRVDMAFTLVEPPSLTYLERPAPSTTAIPTTTTTRTLRPAATTTTTTATTLYIKQYSGFELLLMENAIVMGLAGIVVIMMCLCVCCIVARRRNARMLKAVMSMPRKIKQKRKEWVKSGKPPSVVMGQDLIIEMAKQQHHKHRQAFEKQQHALQGKKVQTLTDGPGPSPGGHGRPGTKALETEADRLQQLLEETQRRADLGRASTTKEEAVHKPLFDRIADKNQPTDVIYLLRSQALCEVVDTIPEDWIAVDPERDPVDENWVKNRKSIRQRLKEEHEETKRLDKSFKEKRGQFDRQDFPDDQQDAAQLFAQRNSSPPPPLPVPRKESSPAPSVGDVPDTSDVAAAGAAAAAALHPMSEAVSGPTIPGSEDGSVSPKSGSPGSQRSGGASSRASALSPGSPREEKISVSSKSVTIGDRTRDDGTVWDHEHFREGDQEAPKLAMPQVAASLRELGLAPSGRLQNSLSFHNNNRTILRHFVGEASTLDFDHRAPRKEGGRSLRRLDSNSSHQSGGSAGYSSQGSQVSSNSNRHKVKQNRKDWENDAFPTELPTALRAANVKLRR